MHFFSLQHMSLMVGLASSLATLTLIVISGAMLVGYLRKAVLQASEQTAKVWRDAAEAEKARNVALQSQLSNIEERFTRLEHEHMTQARQLEMFKRKAEYHDSIVRIIISIKTYLPGDALERIEMLLKEMIEYCDKAELDIISIKQSAIYFDHLRRRDDAAALSDLID